MSQGYNEEQIQILEGLEAVRKRPGMYIGSTSVRGLHHLVWEIVDNAVDEAVAGYGSTISITIHKDNSITVTDKGRGIPIGKNKKLGISTLEVVLTVLHAGGKFGGPDSGYKSAGGLHGVGASVTNALSEKLKATVYRDGNIYEMAFERGKKIGENDIDIVGETDPSHTGTSIWFKPDPLIFTETTEFEFYEIYKRMRESAFLNRGLEFVLIDERELDDETDEYVKKTIQYERGIVQYIEFVNEGKKLIHKDIFFATAEKDKVMVDVAFQYHDGDKEGIYSFANNIKTPEGGTHETGFKHALTSVTKDYMTAHSLIKGKKEFPTGEDTRAGLTAIISVKISGGDVQFEGQTKSKLGNSEVNPIVRELVSQKLQQFFDENPKTAEAIMAKIIQSSEIRQEMKKRRELEKKKRDNMTNMFAMPEKLADAQSNDKEKIELFVVEGDSAGGSAKQGRDRVFQAVLPLRGKIINTEKVKLSRILENAEIRAIAATMGTGLGDDFDYEKRAYKKLIIMTDADVDGSHIRVLILTFLFRYMRPLIENGHVYIAKPPLYKITHNRKVQYAYTDSEKDAIIEKLGGNKPSIQRYKGLGEMDGIQLWETTMDPEHRTLTEVTLEDAFEADRLVSGLMGQEVTMRKAFVEENSHKATNLDV